jgi:hypothetical protein
MDLTTGTPVTPQRKHPQVSPKGNGSKARAKNPSIRIQRSPHAHDHYHVSHHHRGGALGGALGEWEHRTSWHTHEHNHVAITHSHDYEQAEEEHHAKEAHLHDHEHPTHSPG